YARTLVRLERGDTIARAPRVFEADQADVGVFPRVERDDGATHIFVQRATSFFETEYYYSNGGAGDGERLPVPLNADLYGVLDGQALFLLREPWRHADATYAQGDLVAYDLASGRAETVFAAAENQALQNVGVGETGIVIQYLEDVSGYASRLSRDERGGW